jgi:hypothetical protein
MATLQELERALVNAHNAGDVDAARKLAVVVSAARKDSANLIPGVQATGYSEPKPESTLGEKGVGAGEAALATITGAVGGTVGMTGGMLKGMAQEAIAGQYGTPQAANRIEQEAMRGAQALTYAPRTEAGQDITRAVGEIAAPLAAIAPAMPIAQMSQLAQATRPLAQAAGTVARAGVAKAAPVVQKAAQSIAKTAKEPFGDQSIGAAETPVALQRRTVAEQMPVPFRGESALTKGQASRSFEDLQFEKETAKRSDAGKALRNRVEQQSETLLQNFDALSEVTNPQTVDVRELGRAIDAATRNKASNAMNRVRAAYRRADEQGETMEPVQMDPVVNGLQAIQRYEGVAPVASSIRREAVRLGVVNDVDGQLQPGRVPIRDAELFRQFINDATDWGNRRESMVARQVISAIDDATENVGGANYRAARGLRRQYAQEFENVGLTRKILGTKRGTDERQIAYDDVFDRVVLSSSLEEMNKMRRTLISGGRDGKQAWNDVKSRTIQHIKESALSQSQTDSKGNPIISVDKLNKTIANLDRDGKLDSMFGKRQAQVIRDLGDMSRVIYTAPPGAINHSNTASALQVALDSVVTFGLTGIPAPAATALREAAKYVKDRKLQQRIKEHLSEPRNQ